jgi:hypothetical protein
MTQIITEEMQAELSLKLDQGLEQVSRGIAQLARDRDELLNLVVFILDDTDSDLSHKVRAAIDDTLKRMVPK